MARGEVFLTGATGFIGSGVLAKLLAAEPDLRVNLLVRSRRGELPQARAGKILAEIRSEADRASDIARVTVIEGDISRHRFGLESRDYQELAARVSRVIHCAAAVRFDLPLEEARAINVAGSENVVALARTCTHLERLDYVGTAYVAGKRTGIITEDELDQGQDHNNTYEQTKLESEKLMRQAMRDLPIAVLRPSIVICDSRTGRISRYSAIFRVLRAYCRGQIKMLPGCASTLMDIVPMDYVADVADAVGRDPGTAGRCYHLAAGPTRMTPVGEVIALAAEHFGRERLALVPPAGFDAWVTSHAGKLSDDERDLIDEIRIYQPYLTSSPQFDTSNTREVTERLGISLPELKSYFGKMAAYIGTQSP